MLIVALTNDCENAFYVVLNQTAQAYALTSGAHPNFPSNHGFRLIFNGRIITDRIDGCASELCDLDVLLNILEPIVLLVEDCNLSEAAPVSSRWSQIKERGVTIQQTIIIAIICCILSSIVTFTFVTGRLLCTNRYRHPKRAYEKVDGTGTAERKPSVDSTFSAAVDEYFDTAIEVPTPKNYTCLYGAADEAKNGDSSMNNRLDDRFVID